VLLRDFMDLNLSAVPPAQQDADVASAAAISTCAAVVDDLAMMDSRINGELDKCSSCLREFSPIFPRVRSPATALTAAFASTAMADLSLCVQSMAAVMRRTYMFLSRALLHCVQC
jgi:hypothetical protein